MPKDADFQQYQSDIINPPGYVWPMEDRFDRVTNRIAALAATTPSAPAMPMPLHTRRLRMPIRSVPSEPSSCSRLSTFWLTLFVVALSRSEPATRTVTLMPTRMRLHTPRPADTVRPVQPGPHLERIPSH